MSVFKSMCAETMLARFIQVFVVVCSSFASNIDNGVRSRQVPTDCPDTFQLTFNPCTDSGSPYFPVPNHPEKFVQCDLMGRAYVVQCPSGLIYNHATTSCISQQPLTTAPPGPTFDAGILCTEQAVSAGQVFFPYPGDNRKFYECTGVLQARELTCPDQLVFDMSRLACVYPGEPNTHTPQGTPATTIATGTQEITNPCTPQQLASNHYYFPHPDPTKFIQCGPLGAMNIVSCPPDLVWNQYEESCANPFFTGILG